jgi:hypothetical protein
VTDLRGSFVEVQRRTLSASRRFIDAGRVLFVVDKQVCDRDQLGVIVNGRVDRIRVDRIRLIGPGTRKSVIKSARPT